MMSTTRFAICGRRRLGGWKSWRASYDQWDVPILGPVLGRLQRGPKAGALRTICDSQRSRSRRTREDQEAKKHHDGLRKRRAVFRHSMARAIEPLLGGTDDDRRSQRER